MKDLYGNTIQSLAQVNEKRIVLLVMDGVGDCSNDGKGTALQMADTPNMDSLAKKSALGLAYPVAPGITPGSGPGHLGLFGYDPLIYEVGRGVLSALGIDFDLQKQDIAARLNFCTLDEEGNVTDRRAGRIPTEENERLVRKIKENLKPEKDTDVFLETVSEHRALLVIRGDNLTDELGDTDPQATQVPPLDPDRDPYGTSHTTGIVKDLLKQIREILKDEKKANFILTRGFSKIPEWPSFSARYQLNPTAVAGYPMYKGIARLLGMEIFSEPKKASDICHDVADAMKDHTFVFGHFKYTDKTGEDGDLAGKIKVIEEMDRGLPQLLQARPDVLIITGDHSTPPSMKSHSWHPVPVLMFAPFLRGGSPAEFNELSCRNGELGTIYAREIMPLAMAHAQKLKKFGA